MMLLGAVITFAVMTASMSAEYGRMSNHKICDMSVDNLATLELHKDCKYH